MVSGASPASKPFSTRLFNVVVSNPLEGGDLSGNTIPTFLLYGADDTTLPIDANDAALESLSETRRIVYEGFGHLEFYISEPKITTDIIVILGNGASTLLAAASTLTLMSLL